MPKTGVENSFEYYSTLINGTTHAEKELDMELHGLDAAGFKKALQDPSTVLLRGLPWATPLSHHPWANMDLLRRLCGGRDVLLMSRLDQVVTRATYQSAIRELVASCLLTGSVVFSEGPGAYIDTLVDNFRDIADSMGLQCDNLLEDSGYMRTCYAALLIPVDACAPASVDWEFSTLEDHNIRKGLRTTCVSDKMAEEVWAFYEPRFAEICTDDPISASFTHDEFMGVLKDGRFLKIIALDDASPVGLGLIADIRHCEWMNQEYFLRNFPREYGNGLMWYSPGILTKYEGDVATVMTLFSMARDLIVRTGIEPRFSFVCNGISVSQVPGIANRLFNKGGLRAEIEEPVCYEKYAALVFEPASS